MPEHRVYVEPFGGAASVLLRKAKSYAEVYNDLDGEVVNLFRVVRERGEDLACALRLTPFSRADYLEAWEPSEDALEQARRTVIRSFMGFGSAAVTRQRSPRSKAPEYSALTGFRANSNRSGTTPARDWFNYPDSIAATVERLRGVTIECRDAAEVVLAHDVLDCLHYVDPPYVSSTRDAGGDYRHEMTDVDHARLAATLRGVKGMVMLSGYRCDLYDDLYAGWERLDRAALADGAKPRTECLWFNDAAWNRRPEPNIFSERHS